MPVQIIRNDITRMQVDAIVNAANPRLSDGGGVTGAIHRAAGPGLLAECMKLGGCSTGEARITGAYALPCTYVIHTVGPIWQGGGHGEAALLAACYRSALELAQAHHCASIAFPLISTGAYGYPRDQALKVAMDAIGAFLLSSDSDMQVSLVVFTKESVSIGQKLFSSIAQYIDDRYVDAHYDRRRETLRAQRTQSVQHAAAPIPPAASADPGDAETAVAPALEDALRQIDESFSQMVLRIIAEKGMRNAECYRKANIDRKLFSKIANDVHYTPRKTTAVALAIALELPLAQARELLGKAGYALSHSSRFDIIIEYCITYRIYNIHEVNIILYDFGEDTLGV